jgi:predicted nucleic acid-binding protein
VILPDVDVLVNAFRADAPYHAVCRSWLDRIIRQDARFRISPLVVSVVRISTNRRAFAQPSTLADALGFCDDLYYSVSRIARR